MSDAVFHDAGCPACLSAEQQLAEAEAAGVMSVAALVIGGTQFHTNYGAALADLRQSREGRDRTAPASPRAHRRHT